MLGTTVVGKADLVMAALVPHSPVVHNPVPDRVGRGRWTGGRSRR
jgi:hypothetical protein